jgi:hypothetical protein
MTERYTALRDFLLGYLGEDTEAEYGSAEGAARQFLRDAKKEEVQKVLEQWESSVSSAETLADVNRRLRRLGSAWLFRSEDEVERVSKILRRGARTRS